jgi:hypothetical protein
MGDAYLFKHGDDTWPTLLQVAGQESHRSSVLFRLNRFSYHDAMRQAAGVEDSEMDVGGNIMVEDGSAKCALGYTGIWE